MSIEVNVFENDWYPRYINQTLREEKDASEDARCIANAIMTGAAFIAQSIDRACNHEDMSLADCVLDLGKVISEYSEMIRDQIE